MDMKTTTITLTIILAVLIQVSFAQSVGINSTGDAPTANAMLEVLQTKTSGTVYGFYGTATGAATTNYAGYFSATNATNNYGLVVLDGNVGIGTTSPNDWKFEISTSQNAFRVNKTTNEGYLASFGGEGDISVDAPGISGGRFIIKDAGNVGIGGATTPESRLHIKQSANDSTGGLTLEMSGTTTDKWRIVVGSDYDLHFMFNGSDRGKIRESDGVYEVLMKSNSNIINPSYGDEMIPLLTKAIQEQQTEIESLKKELAEIKYMLQTNN